MRYLAVALALTCLPGMARADWYEASSTNFVVYADDSAADVKRFAERLEYFHGAMEVITGQEVLPPSPSNRVTVFAVKSLTELKRIFGDTNSAVAGFYVPRAGRSVAFVPPPGGASRLNIDPMTILLHEYTHHFMISNSSFSAPRWYQEGGAEFFSATRFQQDGTVALGLPQDGRYNEFRYAREVSAEDLLDPDAYEKHRREGIYDSFYGKSWLLFHYLIFDEERRGQMGQYLRLLVAGRKMREAAEEAFGDLDKLDINLQGYMNKPRLMTMEFRPGQLEAGPVKLRRLSQAEEAIMPVRIRSTRGVDDKIAAELVEQARAVVGQYPEDAAVLTALAEAEFDAGNDAEAIAAADKAIAIDPSQVNAYLQKGYALFRMADEEFYPKPKKDEEGEEKEPASGADEQADADEGVAAEVQRKELLDPERAAEARVRYRAALEPFLALNAIENDHPLPLLFLYRSYGSRGAQPTATAVQALERAAELAPFDYGLKLMLITQWIRDKEYDKARIPLEAVAYSPHGGPLAEAATRMIEAMASDNPPEPEELLEMFKAKDEEGESKGGDDGS